MRDSKGIGSDQLEDFRRSFLHFDKSRTRRLEPKEFRACLVSLGYGIKDDKQVGDCHCLYLINSVVVPDVMP